MNKDLPKLLRAIASGSNAVRDGHTIILNMAADEIERLRHADGRIVDLERALAGLMGLVTLITGRDDLPLNIRSAMIESHRYREAQRVADDPDRLRWVACEVCGGSGEIIRRDPQHVDPAYEYAELCGSCEGYGRDCA